MRVASPLSLSAVVLSCLLGTASAQFPMLNLSLPVQQRPAYYPQQYVGYNQVGCANGVCPNVSYRPPTVCNNGVCRPVQTNWNANCPNGFCATPVMNNWQPNYYQTPNVPLNTYQTNYQVNPGYYPANSVQGCQPDAYGRCTNFNHSHYGQQVQGTYQPVGGTTPYFSQYPNTLVPANYNQLAPTTPVNNYYLGQVR